MTETEEKTLEEQLVEAHNQLAGLRAAEREAFADGTKVREMSPEEKSKKERWYNSRIGSANQRIRELEQAIAKEKRNQ